MEKVDGKAVAAGPGGGAEERAGRRPAEADPESGGVGEARRRRCLTRVAANQGVTGTKSKEAGGVAARPVQARNRVSKAGELARSGRNQTARAAARMTQTGARRKGEPRTLATAMEWSIPK